jgi:TonB family protein
VESVDIERGPLPGLGFEDAVRACVTQWRFEPGPAEGGVRRYEGHLRFRLGASDEDAVRALLASLVAAWNSGDMKALDDLALRSTDTTKALPSGLPPLREQLREGTMQGQRMALDPDLKYLRFLGPDAVAVGQPIRRGPLEPHTGQATDAETLILDVIAAKGSRGWRFLRVAPQRATWLEGIRVGGSITEPHKTKDAKPLYPETAKAARIQGVVVLDCLITPEGKVTGVRVLRGIPLLDGAAVEAVRHWEYTPTLIDGKPVPVIMTVTVNFRLR